MFWQKTLSVFGKQIKASLHKNNAEGISYMMGSKLYCKVIALRIFFSIFQPFSV